MLQILQTQGVIHAVNWIQNVAVVRIWYRVVYRVQLILNCSLLTFKFLLHRSVRQYAQANNMSVEWIQPLSNVRYAQILSFVKDVRILLENAQDAATRTNFTWILQIPPVIENVYLLSIELATTHANSVD